MHRRCLGLRGGELRLRCLEIRSGGFQLGRQVGDLVGDRSRGCDRRVALRRDRVQLGLQVLDDLEGRCVLGGESVHLEFGFVGTGARSGHEFLGLSVALPIFGACLLEPRPLLLRVLQSVELRPDRLQGIRGGRELRPGNVELGTVGFEFRLAGLELGPCGLELRHRPAGIGGGGGERLVLVGELLASLFQRFVRGSCALLRGLERGLERRQGGLGLLCTGLERARPARWPRRSHADGHRAVTGARWPLARWWRALRATTRACAPGRR